MLPIEFFGLRSNTSTYFWFDDSLKHGRLIDITRATAHWYNISWSNSPIKSICRRSRNFQSLYAHILEEPAPAFDLKNDVNISCSGNRAMRNLLKA
ncbi:hypothetical protein HID58_029619 [Brassica napus]|uniref:Uncharacterized protein n=1 Tax=Brassica napus TaxID=3708 RepID=A0ABQ8CF99_BRANA|nr:hypothetical protein HID58_029619 [Brassica napus]